jgi:hypothetical protein
MKFRKSFASLEVVKSSGEVKRDHAIGTLGGGPTGRNLGRLEQEIPVDPDLSTIVEFG